MLFYLSIIIGVFFLLMFPKSKIIFWGIFLSLLFLSMFRGENVGTDTANYIEIALHSPYTFTNPITITKESTSHAYELTYILVITVTQLFKLSPFFIIYFFSAITFFFLYKALVAFLPSKYISIGLFIWFILDYYFISFNTARQVAAVSVLLYAYSFLNKELIKKNISLFFFWVIFASTIHFSSILALPIAAVAIIKIPRWATNFMVLTFLFLYLFYSSIWVSITTLLTPTQYERYLKLYLTDFNHASFNGKIFDVLFISLSLAIYNLSYNKTNRVIRNLFIFSFLFFLAVRGLHPYILRTAQILTIIQVPFFANALITLRKEPLAIFLFLGLLFLTLYDLLVSFNGINLSIIPYQFNFN